MRAKLKRWTPAPGEVIVPFFEGNLDRVLRLFSANLQVRSPTLLEPKFHNNEFCGIVANLPPAWGFVYIFPAGQLLKIGISQADVEARWRNIKTGNPLLEPAIYVSPPVGGRAREIEAAAHSALAEHHESGEWFRCSQDLAIQTVQRLVEDRLHG